MAWLLFTLGAALAQAVRNALQKQLSARVSVSATTLARFFYAAPLSLAYLLSHYRGGSLPLPAFPPAFFAYTAGSAAAQILATVLMVRLFKLKNYAVGVGLVRSEAVFAALVGAAFYGSRLGWLAWAGVFVGALGVLLLSGAGHWRQISPRVLAYGLLGGLLFALTSLWVRQAALLLELPPLSAAAWVLFCVITLQAVLLWVWMRLREAEALRRLFARPGLMLATGAASCTGSLCWFSAFALQDVAVVKTVGQVEIVFVLAISALFFKEGLYRQNLAGLALVVAAAVMVAWP